MHANADRSSLAHAGRAVAVDTVARDGAELGTGLVTGSRRRENGGRLFEPTILACVPRSAWIMREQPTRHVATVDRLASFGTAPPPLASCSFPPKHRHGSVDTVRPHPFASVA